jgi:membrane-associated progesterone receptor component
VKGTVYIMRAYLWKPVFEMHLEALIHVKSFSQCLILYTHLMDTCRAFYGPGGAYALFTGKDASRALAKMSFEPQDLNGDISGLGPFELEALQDWEYKFMGKYVKVGTIKKNVPVEDGNTTSTALATNETAAETEPEKAPATQEKPREVVAEEVKEKEAPADKEASADEGAKES